ncbi:hypothetical protein HK097_003566 [Rhizophlyctis rosea]|uniref:Glutamate--cysteine ligase n=1 Tax=Rhizophlyctis rosea TaxID=64517 RepID=A0AAD5SI29_9FUNG|nr:hypothetical protein HK097_003566 [Rhizophlyctis rosea]
MGLLSLGTPLPWDEAKNHADHVRKHGIIQFLNIWRRLRNRRRDKLLWGDEVEYVVVSYNDGEKRAKLSLRAHDALAKLQQIEIDDIASGRIADSSWKPEYGRYMLEGTPGVPYGSTLEDLLTVEDNMRRRRQLAQSCLKPNEAVFTFTSFPRLGTCNSLEPGTEPTPDTGASCSLFIPDEAINPHARFPTLTANIRLRRGSKVSINMPIFHDTNTPKPWYEPVPPCLTRTLSQPLPAVLSHGCSDGTRAQKEEHLCNESLNPKALPSLQELVPDALADHIYMDCMCFGMGCCCLQITFQACSVEEARRLYDQLTVVTPVMLALTAAAPIFRGYLADVDVRWSVIAGSVDDRTAEERGLQPLKNSRYRIPKSRYESISLYLSPGPNYSGGCSETDVESPPPGGVSSRPTRGGEFFKDKYNDLEVPFDKEIYRQLIDGGVDEHLAKHYAHLFIRDPLVIFQELLEQDDTASSDHFENIQSTNWQTMRFKPPPPASDIGWRVEFRSMEIQLTDKENAAFAVFVVLLTRAILSFDLNFYIPLSKVDENMRRGHGRDAVLGERFWFRRNVFGNPAKRPAEFQNGVPGSVVNGVNGTSVNGVAEVREEDEDVCDEMTIDEIINGKPSTSFPGLIPLVRAYLHTISPPISTLHRLESYLELISKKANGELPTTARWIREFVRGHKGYKGDSKVSEEVLWDLCKVVEGWKDGREVVGLNA